MPGILVIEDVRVFGFECTYARTLGEAERLLFSQPWDEVWFDHDLGAIGSDDNTYHLALRLEEMAHSGSPHPIGRVVVHSANPGGADRLVAALRAYRPVRVDANEYIAEGQTPMHWPGG